MELKLCLTAKSTRDQLVIKNMLKQKEYAKDYPNDDNKLWIENQSGCVHSLYNFKYLENLAGDSGGYSMYRGDQSHIAHSSNV